MSDTTGGHESPIPTPYAQRLDTFKRRRLPVIVWAIAALVCLWIFAGRVRRFEYMGLAQALQYEVAANSVGRVEAVTVALYDEVEVGDVVAKLDDAALAATIETANASVEKLGADLEAARTQMLASGGQDRSSWQADLRRFQINEEERRLDLLGLRVTIETDQVALERLAIELKRAGALLEKGLIGQQEYDANRLGHDEVRKRIDKNKILLEQTEVEYAAAQERRQGFEQRLPSPPRHEPLLQPLRDAIEIEQRRLREIQLQRESLVLHSPVSGQVSQILCRKGDTVVPGEPILTIAERSAREIVAYLDEASARPIDARTRVLVSSATRPAKAAESVVVRVGAGIEQLPQRLWLDPATPVYGRAVVIAGVPTLGLTPGERVGVRFLADR